MIPALQGTQEGESYLCLNSRGMATTPYGEPKVAQDVNKTQDAGPEI